MKKSLFFILVLGIGGISHAMDNNPENQNKIKKSTFDWYVKSQQWVMVRHCITHEGCTISADFKDYQKDVFDQRNKNSKQTFFQYLIFRLHEEENEKDKAELTTILKELIKHDKITYNEQLAQDAFPADKQPEDETKKKILQCYKELISSLPAHKPHQPISATRAITKRHVFGMIGITAILLCGAMIYRYCSSSDEKEAQDEMQENEIQEQALT